MLVSVFLKQSFSPPAVGRQKTRSTSRSNHPSAQAGGREAALHCCQLQALIHAAVLHPGQPVGVQRLWKQGSGPRAGICVLHPCWAQHHRRGEWNLSFKTRAKWRMQIAISVFAFVQKSFASSPYTDPVTAPDVDPQPIETGGDGLIWVVGPVLAVVFIICIVIAILLYKKWVDFWHVNEYKLLQFVQFTLPVKMSNLLTN